MKEFAKLLSVFAISVSALIGCSDGEDDRGVLKFQAPAVYIEKAMSTASVPFEAIEVKNLQITQKPQGWNDITLDRDAQKINIVVPEGIELLAEEGDKEPVKPLKSGKIILSGVSNNGTLKSATLFVTIANTIDLTAKPANSYVLTEGECNYLFTPTKGENTSLQLKSVKVIWQSGIHVIEYLTLDKGKVSFYIGNMKNKDTIVEGNALLGGYDENNQLLWSWHIWATPANVDVQTIDLQNGFKLMDRNLGALNHKNGNPAEILSSLGLYYQWGRPTPFPGPSNYRGDLGGAITVYDADGKRLPQDNIASSDKTGNMEYALQHPMHFITSTIEKGSDWMQSSQNDLWSSHAKTVNDPCPHGWRVAPKSAFEGLTITTAAQEADYDKFGLMLGDGSQSTLWMGAGRKVYLTGKFLNIYNPLPGARNFAQEAQPWEGLYWTSDVATGKNATAFHFWFEKKTTSFGLETASEYGRANGFPVRCVKE